MDRCLVRCCGGSHHNHMVLVDWPPPYQLDRVIPESYIDYFAVPCDPVPRVNIEHYERVKMCTAYGTIYHEYWLVGENHEFSGMFEWEIDSPDR